MAEFAFDIVLYSVARVEDATKEEAIKKLLNVVDCLEINHEHDGVKLTEASLGADTEPKLFEIDGEAI